MASRGYVRVSGASEGEVTLGVAIAVPEPFASELREQRASFGDTRAETVPTHVTLLPPMTIGTTVLGQVRAHLLAVSRRHQAFPMALRGTGTFRPVSPVVFVTIAQGISECELLSEAVCAGPLAAQLPFPYHPHVTVAHDLGDSELDRAFKTLADYACGFDVDSFRLYVHDARAGWIADTVFALRQD